MSRFGLCPFGSLPLSKQAKLLIFSTVSSKKLRQEVSILLFLSEDDQIMNVIHKHENWGEEDRN